MNFNDAPRMVRGFAAVGLAIIAFAPEIGVGVVRALNDAPQTEQLSPHEKALQKAAIGRIAAHDTSCPIEVIAHNNEVNNC